MSNLANVNFYRSLADGVVLFHFAFVGFVLLGGLIVLRWRRTMWLHLPAVAWGIFIQLSYRRCPLTPLENRLRERGAGDAYAGGFVDHYIMPVLYPDGLTRDLKVAIALLIIVLNAACYGFILYRKLRRGGTARAPAPAPAEVGADAADLAPPASAAGQ